MHFQPFGRGAGFAERLRLWVDQQLVVALVRDTGNGVFRARNATFVGVVRATHVVRPAYVHLGGHDR